MAHIAENELIEYIKANQNKLYKIAFTYTRNQELALDVVQEAITKALENIGKIKNEEYVKTWFYRILINEALKTIKRNKNFSEYELIDNEVYIASNEENIVENMDIYKCGQRENV